jgi:hypothetical protein
LNYLFVNNKNKVDPEITNLLKEIENFPVEHSSNSTFVSLFGGFMKSHSKNDNVFAEIIKKDVNFGNFVAGYVGK